MRCPVLFCTASDLDWLDLRAYLRRPGTFTSYQLCPRNFSSQLSTSFALLTYTPTEATASPLLSSVTFCLRKPVCPNNFSNGLACRYQCSDNRLTSQDGFQWSNRSDSQGIYAGSAISSSWAGLQAIWRRVRTSSLRTLLVECSLTRATGH